MIPYVSSEFNTAVANPRGFVGYVGCAWRCPCRDLGKEAWAVRAVCHRAGAGEDNRAATEFGSGSGGEGQGCEGSHRHLHVCLQPEHWNASTTDPVIFVTSYTREEKGRERGREPESKMPGRTEPRAKGGSDMSEYRIPLFPHHTPSQPPASAAPSLATHLAGSRTSEWFFFPPLKLFI